MIDPDQLARAIEIVERKLGTVPEAPIEVVRAGYATLAYLYAETYAQLGVAAPGCPLAGCGRTEVHRHSDGTIWAPEGLRP